MNFPKTNATITKVAVAKLTASIALAMSFAGLFVACSDDSGSSTTDNNTGLSVETLDDLPSCTINRLGTLYDVASESALFVCNTEEWIETMGVYNTLDELPNCTDKRLYETYFIIHSEENYKCLSKKWVKESLILTGSSSSSTPISGGEGEPTGGEEKISSSSAVISSDSHEMPFSSSREFLLSSSSERLSSSNSAPTFSSSSARTLSSSSENRSSSSEVQISSSSVSSSSVQGIAELEGIGECTASREAERVFVENLEQYFTCLSKFWVKDSVAGFSVRNASITGAAQKGPFKFKSPIYIYELLSDSLNLRAGRSYTDEVSSNQGDFAIPKVNLVYPIAELVVSGPFLNEVKNQYTAANFEMHSIADLSKDNEANINILTHLAYKRILKLLEKGYNFATAKKQAEQEIMTSFGLSNTVAAEHSTIYNNATMMAISLLFMGERSDASIQTAIDNYISDFEKDGEWNDSTTKAQMADWVYAANWLNIHANVDDWNIVDIADFHTEILKFRNNAWGLGGCTDNRNGVVSPVTMKYSQHQNEYFICGWNNPSADYYDKWQANKYIWHKADTIEYDTYQWTKGYSGELRMGNMNKNVGYVYDSISTTSGKWRKADSIEIYLGGCVARNKDTVGLADTTWYICKNKKWTKATLREYDLFGWAAGEDGEIKKGNVSDVFYVYDASTSSAKWREATSTEIMLGGCVARNADSVGLANKVWYICKNRKWIEATQEEYDLFGWASGEDGEIKKGNGSDVVYVYDASTSPAAWRVANDVEKVLGGCVARNADSVGLANDVWYICKNRKWIEATQTEYDVYGWAAGEDGEIKKGNVSDMIYVYDASTSPAAWRVASEPEKVFSGCVARNADSVGLANDVWYICRNRAWIEATQTEYDVYGWEAGEDGEIKKGNVSDVVYVYDASTSPAAWRKASEPEKVFGGCVARNADSVGLVNKVWYICKSRQWRAYDVDPSTVVKSTMTDARDRKTYKTVTIGTQTWMAQNLNYEYNERTARSYCYKDKADSCAKYGRLYT